MTDVFYGPRSRANARALLDAVKVLGLDARVVRTTLNGYFVPEEVVASLDNLSHIEEGIVYPVPEENTPPADEPVERPRGNFGREAWAAYYATKFGTDAPEDASRDDIKALVEAKEND